MEQFIYTAVFFVDEESGGYTVAFPDLDISTEGNSLVEAFLFAKDYLRVYCSYARKFDMEIPKPTKFIELKEKFANATCMLIDTIIPQNKEELSY